jgi:hypothetical protein
LILDVEGTVFPQNVWIRLPNDTPSYPRRTESSAMPLQKSCNFAELLKFVGQVESVIQEDRRRGSNVREW